MYGWTHQYNCFLSKNYESKFIFRATHCLQPRNHKTAWPNGLPHGLIDLLSSTDWVKLTSRWDRPSKHPAMTVSSGRLVLDVILAIRLSHVRGEKIANKSKLKPESQTIPALYWDCISGMFTWIQNWKCDSIISESKGNKIVNIKLYISCKFPVGRKFC